MKKEAIKLTKGSIVQLDPVICRNNMFKACLMVVSEVNPWGVQGYVQALGEDGEMGGQAYYRAKWEEIEYCGHVMWNVK